MLDPTVTAELIAIINETYQDRVETIVTAETRPAPGFDGDDLFVIALDGRKQLAIRINETRPPDDQIAIKLLNAAEIDPAGATDPAQFAEAEPPDAVDNWTEETRQAAGAVTDRWVEQIRGLLADAGGLPEFAETLLTVYPDLDGSQLRTIMGDAMTAASLAGAQELPD